MSFESYYKPLVFAGQNRDSVPAVVIQDAYLAAALGTANQQLIAAVTGSIIVVTSLALATTSLAALDFHPAAGGLLRRYLVPANGNVIENFNPHGIFRVTASTALQVDNGGGAICAVAVSYFTVPAA